MRSIASGIFFSILRPFPGGGAMRLARATNAAGDENRSPNKALIAAIRTKLNGYLCLLARLTAQYRSLF
ncbi:hypothetical protein CWN04_13015 [Klebsiella michiganensis]|nr:hypothetical protein CWN04_13015 [Klebsiella michiganensis]